MGYSTTEGKIYLVELESPFESLEIQFVPEEIVMNRTANVVDFAVVGRNNPLHQYTGGDEKMSLKLDFYSDSERRDDVIKKTRWLESLAQNDAGRRPQTLVKVTLSMFDSAHGYLPKQAYVDLQLSLDTKVNIPKSDLRDRKYGV
jgi:hypothetical protein